MNSIFCAHDAHRWKAGWCTCGWMIFVCRNCQTARRHYQEDHDAVMARRRAREAEKHGLVDIDETPVAVEAAT